MRTIVTILVNAAGLWLTTLLLGQGMSVTAYDPGSPVALVVTYLVLGIIWGVVNSVIGGILRPASFCLYVITLGLFALVVNGFLFWLVAWVSDLLGWGLSVESFGWSILGALVLSVITAILGAIFRPRDRARARSGAPELD